MEQRASCIVQQAGVDVNRKVLADLAITDMNAFNELVLVANKALAK